MLSYRHEKGREEVFVRGEKCEYKRLLQENYERRWREKESDCEILEVKRATASGELFHFVAQKVYY